MNEVVIVEGVRTATGVFGGSLSKIPAPVHGAECVKALVERTGIKHEDIDELIIGTHFQAGTKANPARQCGIYAGLPGYDPGIYTKQELCYCYEGDAVCSTVHPGWRQRSRDRRRMRDHECHPLYSA